MKCFQLGYVCLGLMVFGCGGSGGGGSGSGGGGNQSGNNAQTGGQVGGVAKCEPIQVAALTSQKPRDIIVQSALHEYECQRKAS